MTLREGAGEMSRRRFLARSAGGVVAAGVAAFSAGCGDEGAAERDGLRGPPGAGAASGAGDAAPEYKATGEPEWRNRQPTMAYERLGRTNLMVSRVGFGTARTDSRNVWLVDAAIERGLNLIDTARVYRQGQSEKALARLLKKHRDKVWITSKAPNIGGFPSSGIERGEEAKAAQMFRQSLEESLRTLEIDCLDIFMVHGIDTPWRTGIETVREEFEKARREGKVRFLGYSTHLAVPEVMQAGIATGWYDAILVAVNPLELARLGPIIAEARKRGIGVIGMKCSRAVTGPRGYEKAKQLRYREMFDRATGLSLHQRAYAYMLREAGMPTILTEITEERILEENLVLPTKKIARSTWNEIRRAVGIEFEGTCAFCGECNRTCSSGLGVAEVVRYRSYAVDGGDVDAARTLYGLLPADKRQDACRSCSVCAVRCPRGIDVRRVLRDARAVLC